MKTFTTAQIAEAAKCVFQQNEGYDGEPVCPQRFTNAVLDFLDKYGSATEFYRQYPEYAPLGYTPPTHAVLPPIEAIRKVNGTCHVKIGDWVTVVKGKKVRKGTEGKVFWLQDAEYDGKKVTKVGIMDASGQKHYSYTYNLQVR